MVARAANPTIGWASTNLTRAVPATGAGSARAPAWGEIDIPSPCWAVVVPPMSWALLSLRKDAMSLSVAHVDLACSLIEVSSDELFVTIASCEQC